ncbi:FG-GAP-like repeat-containing protein [Streptomyces sp. NPDC096136]|uniref:FG-GAP-like repeat-containing protein n=1 Tax=Streptomyces sp. NPDC096136 TaxID=3366076 RepID=UPI00380EE2FB
MSYAVEDFSYPGAAAIQAEKGVTLKRGDGNLMLQACDGTQDMTVNTRGLKDYCFDVKSKPAYLSLELPSAFGIWTGAYPVKTTIEANGTKTVIDAPANDFTGYGEATSDRVKSTLIELRVTGENTNPPAPAGDSTLAFTGKIAIGEGKRSCTATLVDPRWVLTAKHCFAENPADTSTVMSGMPKEKTTVTVGRTDLTTSGGHTTDVVELVPHADRDLVLARLDKPASTVTPVALSPTPPSVGQDVTVAGFGRTKTDWVPSKIHSATFTTGASDATGVLLAPKDPSDATVCQGDAGGPAVRMDAGKPVLVGVTARSGQTGCLDAANTTAGVYDVRVDDLGQWIKSNVVVPGPDTSSLTDQRALADFNGDGKADLAAVDKNGTLQVYRGRADGTFESTPTAVGTPGVWKTVQRIFAGDFNGDGKRDIAAVWESDRILLHAGKGDGTFATTVTLSPQNATWAQLKHLTRYKVDPASPKDGVLATRPNGELYAYKVGSNGQLDFNGGKKIWPDASFNSVIILGTGDFNGDGRDDVVGVWENGALVRWTGNAAGTLDAGGLAAAGTWTDLKIVTGDVDGDGKLDIVSWKGTKMTFHRGRGNGTFEGVQP